MRRRSISIGTVTILIALGAVDPAARFEGSNSEPGLARAELPPSTPIAAAAAGRIEPVSEERELAATTVGRLVFVATEGDAVSAGDIVAEIDNSDLKAQLAGAEARIKMRQSELERLKNGAREETRREAEAAVADADATVRLADVLLQRRRLLAGTGDASIETVDRARADFDGAVARRKLLAERLALLNGPPRPEDVAIAEANLDMANADAVTLRAQIEKTRLRSPIDGVVLRRYVAIGETVSVQPPTLIATVGDVSQLRIRADVDEADIARVVVGQKAWATADAYGDHRFHGVVTKVGMRLGPKEIRTDAPTERLDTRVLQVLIDLDHAVKLPVGLRVDVFLEPASHSAAEKVVQAR